MLLKHKQATVIFMQFLHKNAGDCNFYDVSIIRCSCNRCDNTLSNGMSEHICCSEIQKAIGKLSFEGSNTTINCITQHEDYQSLTKEVVLMYIDPLLEGKQGRSYKQKAGQGKNGYVTICDEFTLSTLCWEYVNHFRV